MSDLEERFSTAQERIKSTSKTMTTDLLLDLYALYKQASSGDVTGKRPGMLDMKGRAKYDSWEKRKGMSSEQAKEAYISLVNQLCEEK
jgi:acyl-CoA-binding protein